MNSLLLVEDSDHKRTRVAAFLAESFPNITVYEARSFNSASKKLESASYDFVLMDMSLPTYDRSASESGGRFRVLGGQELARKMVRRSMKTKIIFLTQFDAFSVENKSHTLESLDREVRAECGELYGGFIHFDSSKSSWKAQLERILGTVR
jgi:CheY-like chemotaxis protein